MGDVRAFTHQGVEFMWGQESVFASAGIDFFFKYSVISNLARSSDPIGDSPIF